MITLSVAHLLKIPHVGTLPIWRATSDGHNKTSCYFIVSKQLERILSCYCDDSKLVGMLSERTYFNLNKIQLSTINWMEEDKSGRLRKRAFVTACIEEQDILNGLDINVMTDYMYHVFDVYDALRCERYWYCKMWEACHTLMLELARRIYGALDYFNEFLKTRDLFYYPPKHIVREIYALFIVLERLQVSIPRDIRLMLAYHIAS